MTRGHPRNPEVAELAERVHAELPLNRVAIVVPARVERPLGYGVQELLARPAPAPPSLDVRGDAADALLEPEVVHLEPGRDELTGDAPVPPAADPIEKHVPAGAGERGAARIVVEALGVGPLIVSAGRLVRLLARRRDAPDVRARNGRRPRRRAS